MVSKSDFGIKCKRLSTVAWDWTGSKYENIELTFYDYRRGTVRVKTYKSYKSAHRAEKRFLERSVS